MSKQQIIRQTEFDHCFIITAKLFAPHLLQPFVTYQIARDSAVESTVEFFAMPDDAMGEQHAARYQRQVVKLMRLDPDLADALARYQRLLRVLNK